MSADRDIDELIERSSLAPDRLWVRCAACRSRGHARPDGKVARDPFDDDRCAYGHRLARSES